MVALGTPLLEVVDPRDLEVVIDVLSTDGGRVRAVRVRSRPVRGRRGWRRRGPMRPLGPDRDVGGDPGDECPAQARAVRGVG